MHSRLQHSIKSDPCALGLVGWETASREMPFKARQHAGIAMAVLGGRRGYEPHPRYCRDCLGPGLSLSLYPSLDAPLYCLCLVVPSLPT